MYFCGQTFYGDNKSSRSALVDITNINSITLDNGIYDDLFITKNYNMVITNSNKEWSFDTIFHAMFKDNLLAGNIEFALNTITSIRIKQREKGKSGVRRAPTAEIICSPTAGYNAGERQTAAAGKSGISSDKHDAGSGKNSGGGRGGAAFRCQRTNRACAFFIGRRSQETWQLLVRTHALAAPTFGF